MPATGLGGEANKGKPDPRPLAATLVTFQQLRGDERGTALPAHQREELVEFLRDRCPWDAAQTPHSLRRYLLEEAHEVAGTTGRDVPGDLDPDVREELWEEARALSLA